MTRDCLVITDDGRLCVTDYRSLHRAILTVLCNGPKTISDLINKVQETYVEFRYLKPKTYVDAITSLIKEKMIVCRYNI